MSWQESEESDLSEDDVSEAEDLEDVIVDLPAEDIYELLSLRTDLPSLLIKLISRCDTPTFNACRSLLLEPRPLMSSQETQSGIPMSQESEVFPSATINGPNSINVTKLQVPSSVSESSTVPLPPQQALPSRSGPQFKRQKLTMESPQSQATFTNNHLPARHTLARSSAQGPLPWSKTT